LAPATSQGSPRDGQPWVGGCSPVGADLRRLRVARPSQTPSFIHLLWGVAQEMSKLQPRPSRLGSPSLSGAVCSGNVRPGRKPGFTRLTKVIVTSIKTIGCIAALGVSVGSAAAQALSTPAPQSSDV